MTTVSQPEIIHPASTHNYQFDFLDPVIFPVFDSTTNNLQAIIHINYSPPNSQQATLAHAEWIIGNSETRQIVRMLKQAIPNLISLIQDEISKQCTVNLRNNLTIEIMQPIASIASLDDSLVHLPYFRYSRDLFVWKLQCENSSEGIKYRMHAVSAVENPHFPQWWDSYLYPYRRFY